MKTAILVLTHSAAIGVAANIETLSSQSTEFLVHVDRKSPSRQIVSSIEENLSSASRGRVTFLRDPVNAKWGAWSLVEATLRLIREGLASSLGVDYLILLSGDTVPLVDRLGLTRFLQSLGGRSALEYWLWDSSVTGNWRTNRYNSLHLMDWHTKARDTLWDRALDQAPKVLKIRNPDFPIYWGRHWFAITREAAEYIASNGQGATRYTKLFRHTLLPEEAFFHTVLLNEFGSDQVLNRRVVYADYKGPHPPLLRNEDIPGLVGRVPFARKAEQTREFYGFCRDEVQKGSVRCD